jgi:hypothetical protein
MRAEVVGRMLGLRLDGELLRASASRFLERACVPFLREIAVCSRALVSTIVNPSRVRFSLMQDRSDVEGRKRKEDFMKYLEVLLRDSPVQRSYSEAL